MVSLTVPGRSMQKDDSANDCAFPKESFHELNSKGIKGFSNSLTGIFIRKGFMKHKQVKISYWKERSFGDL